MYDVNGDIIKGCFSNSVVINWNTLPDTCEM